MSLDADAIGVFAKMHLNQLRNIVFAVLFGIIQRCLASLYTSVHAHQNARRNCQSESNLVEKTRRKANHKKKLNINQKIANATRKLKVNEN